MHSCTYDAVTFLALLLCVCVYVCSECDDTIHTARGRLSGRPTLVVVDRGRPVDTWGGSWRQGRTFSTPRAVSNRSSCPLPTTLPSTVHLIPRTLHIPHIHCQCLSLPLLLHPR